MSASDSVVPGISPDHRSPNGRSRFAGERAGAWLFAASFSVGIWGLALKVLEPGHPAPPRPQVQHYALLAPSGAPDGRATVVWATDALDSADGYPVIGGAPVQGLSPSAGPAPVQAPPSN